MKVENFKSVKNQFKIERRDGDINYLILQSYDSLVVEISFDLKEACKKTIVLGKRWNQSKTTSKYVYMFLEEEGDINFENVKNKKAYINKLIEDKKILIE